jgi:hypothetical protein
VSKEQLKPKLVPLPCPFCGHAPNLYPQNPDDEGAAWGEVSCVNILCPVEVRVYDGEINADNRGSGAYIDCAIRRWNKRAHQTP